MPLKSGGAVENENMRGRANSGLISIGKVGPTNLYAGLFTSPAGKIVVVDLKTFTRSSAISLTNPYVQSVGVIENNLYAGMYGTQLTRLNLKSLAETVLTLPSAENDIMDLVSDGSFLYCPCAVSNVRAFKVDLGTFTRVAGFVSSWSLGGYCIEYSNGFVYLGVGVGGNYGGVQKLNASDLSLVTTLNLALGEITPNDFLISDGYLYVSCVNSTPARLVKIDLSTFTRVSALSLAYDYGSVLAEKDGFIYQLVGLRYIAKIRLSDFTIVSYLDSGVTTSGGNINATNLVVIGSYLYAGFDTSPGKIVKIDLDTFSVTSTLTLQSGEDYIRGLGAY